jgi:hypothetical protein
MALRGELHPRCKWPDVLVDEARELHDVGMGRKRISAALRVPESTVRDWLRYWTRVYDNEPLRQRNPK